MSYQALARTWRPKTFEDLVGQEHVVKALVHALDGDRLHHAYLFTGTRGVGKTIIARILAKCLNCEKGVSSKPCGECSSCHEIDEGRFVDLIEVDAASRTKVDDTRELLDNVQYAPTRGRYKVYLIDEVHMLSGHSFNALLKTLEEPPPHVKFLLATTDPQKLPVTVLSRCLQFNLKRLPVTLIEPRLAAVTQAEEIGAESTALGLLARSADGSMRDALSLLDQAAAYCEGKLTDAEVRTMLGTIDQAHAVHLLDALAADDARALLDEVAILDERVPDYVAALDEVASLVQRVAIAQVAGVADDDERGDVETIRRLAEAISAEDLQLYYQIALIGKRDLHLAPSRRAGFEMVLLRMAAFRPAEAAQGSAPPVSPTPSGGSSGGGSSSGGGEKAPSGADRVRASMARSTPQPKRRGASQTAPSRASGAHRKATPPVTGNSGSGDTEQAKTEPGKPGPDAAGGKSAPATPDSAPRASVASMPASTPTEAGAPKRSQPPGPSRSRGSDASAGGSPAGSRTESRTGSRAGAARAMPAAVPEPAGVTATAQSLESPWDEDVAPIGDETAIGAADNPADELAGDAGMIGAPANSPDGPAVTDPGLSVPPGPAPVAEESPAQGGAAGMPSDQAGWNDLVSQLNLKGAARQLASSCQLDDVNGQQLLLTLDSARRHLYTDTFREKLRQALSAHCGRELRVQVEIGETGKETLAQLRDRENVERQRKAVEQIARDPNVLALKEAFNATVDESSIRPR